MKTLIKKLFGMGRSIHLVRLIQNGAIILDVRNAVDYKTEHFPGSINIALDQLKNCLHCLPDKDFIIITVCLTGMQSTVASTILKQQGYTRVHYGGSWLGLKKVMQESQ